MVPQQNTGKSMALIPISLHQWRTNYFALELGMDSPILEAIGAYYHWFHAALSHYRRNPSTFDWNQDEVILLRIVKRDGNALQHIQHHTYELCRAAITQNPDAMQYMSRATQENFPDLGLTVAQTKGRCLMLFKYQTADMCLAAVSTYGSSLQYVSIKDLAQRNELRSCAEICLAAVKNNGLALTHVLKIMRALQDRGASAELAALTAQYHNICLAAVTQTGSALRHVDAQIQADWPDIVLTALRQNKEAARMWVKFRNREITDLLQESKPHHRWGCRCAQCQNQ